MDLEPHQPPHQPPCQPPDEQPHLPPRLTDRVFPAYRHRPGHTPHPTRSPEGHSYQPDSVPESFPDLNHSDALACEQFRYGVDLFNAGYWWECHEAMEALWHVAGRGSPAGHVLQAVIMCAAAHIKVKERNLTGARRLFANAEQHVHEAERTNLGLDLIGMLAETGAFVTEDTPTPATLVPLE